MKLHPNRVAGLRLTLVATLLAASAGMVTLTAVATAQQASPPPPLPPGPVTTAWPLRIESPAGMIAVYEPQPEKLDGNTLTARAAVSLTVPGATDPQFGAMWFTSQVFTDRDARTVTMQNIAIRQVKLPNSNPDQEKQFGDAVTQSVPEMAVKFSLDQLESTLGVVEKAREESKTLQTAPPKIVVANVPTTLVLIDGQPKLQQGQTQGVMRVVNTPFVLLLDLAGKQYYLKAGSYWMTAGDVMGQWAVTGQIPAGIAAEANIVSPPVAPDPNAPPAAPTAPTAILVAEEPTELICTTGAPTYTPLPGNDLLYLTNTTSDVFVETATSQFYVLLSGRWYHGPSLNGPWDYVASNALPAAFARIPTDSPKANVLVSVAGTQMATDARMDAYIPQTCAVSRSAGAQLTVSYDGDPAFVPVQNTPIQYASNCADPVLLVDNGYYCCHQAVWYQAATPVGPWVVCTSVPQVIYTLPPSCPVYNCRYVYVYESTPDVVYCGYLPGYTGCYVYGGTIVYGTGYYYPGWYGHEYIPRPYTYGFAPRYDYRYSSWGYGSTAVYNQTWFVNTPTRHDWFGPQGYVDYHRDFADNRTVVNNRVVNNNVTVNRINIYNRTENVKRNVNVTVNNATNVNNRTRVVNDNTKVENNVYAGHDGQVYRRTDTGWETRSPTGWTATKTVPEAKPAEARTTDARPGEVRTAEPARETPKEQAPARETPKEVAPAKETPARETPASEAPTREAPARETPARETPARETPARSETPPGGLEDDHAARERGSSRGGSAAPAEQHSSAPAAEHGGGGGGGNGGGNGDKNRKQ